MTFLPKTIDVYIQPSEIFTPISEELTTYIRKLHKKVSVPRLRAVEDLLKKTYKTAPATVKTLTADNVKVIKKLIKSFEKLRDADNPQKEKKYQEAIYETLPSFLSDLALIAKEHNNAVSPAVPKIIACLDEISFGFLTKKSPLTFAN